MNFQKNSREFKRIVPFFKGLNLAISGFLEFERRYSGVHEFSTASHVGFSKFSTFYSRNVGKGENLEFEKCEKLSRM